MSQNSFYLKFRLHLSSNLYENLLLKLSCDIPFRYMQYMSLLSCKSKILNMYISPEKNKQ